MFNPNEAEMARTISHAAVDLLARREHSYHELQTKLARRFKYGDLIDTQLDALAASDLQSDSRFCETFVRSRSQKGGGGGG